MLIRIQYCPHLWLDYSDMSYDVGDFKKKKKDKQEMFSIYLSETDPHTILVNHEVYLLRF